MADIFSNIPVSRDINYISRDFATLRVSLVNYLIQQFPNDYSDFTTESSGMAFLELVCYVGDILNFYIDKQFNEVLGNPQEEKNIISNAKNLGYTPRGKAPGVCNNGQISWNYPTTGSASANYEFILQKGTRVATKSGISFEFSDFVDSSVSSNKSTVVDTVNNVVSASITGISIVAGISKQFNYVVTSPVPFLKIQLPDSNILEIVSVTSSDGNTWYQTDYLAQESIPVGVLNQDNSSTAAVPYSLVLQRVPRRFVVEKAAGDITFVRFGTGTQSLLDSQYIPNPEDFILPITLRGAVSGFSPASVDPSNFINTGTLGMAPSNVTLTFTYRTGGGLATNIASNAIVNITQRIINYYTPGNTFNKALLENSLKFTNLTNSSGGDEQEDLQTLKENAAANFAAQDRIVTLQDYIVRTATMPVKFGTVFRTTAAKDPNDRLGIKLAMLSRQSDGTLTSASYALKVNVVNYISMFKSWSENLNITDANIINIKVNFGIMTDNLTHNSEILANCFTAITNFFDIRRWNIGDSISTTQVIHELLKVSGVVAVPYLFFTNIVGPVNNRTYSSFAFDIPGHTKNTIIRCLSDSIFELRFPNFDVLGAVL